MKHTIQILLLFLSSMAFSQEKLQVLIKVRLDGKAPISYSVLEEETVFSQGTSSSTNLKFDLPFNGVYFIKITKPDYFPALLEVNTDIPEGLLEENPDFPAVKLKIDLIEYLQSQDLIDVANSARGEVYYDYSIDNFRYEEFVSNLELAEYVKLYKEEEDVLADLAEIDTIAIEDEDPILLAYENALKQASAYFAAQDYQEAKTMYQQASSLLPDAVFPKDRMIEIDFLLRIEQEQTQKYNELIAKADKNVETTQYDSAILYYTSAQKVAPDKPYPTNQIELIRKLLANQQLVAARQDSMRRNEEQLQRQEEAYNQHIEEANEAYQNGNYPLAINSYNKASRVFPLRVYPKTMIEKINAETQERDTEYKRLIAQADQAYKTENYIIAQQYYKEALRLKENESYPKNQLVKIENLLQAQRDIQMEQYNKHIAEAQSFFAKEGYQQAVSAYSKAYTIFQTDSVQLRIDEINDIIASQITAEQQKLLDEYLAKARATFKTNDYAVSQFWYKKALRIKPNDKAIKQEYQQVLEKLQ